MTRTSKLTTFGLLAVLAGSTLAPAMADQQSDKNNLRNLAIGGGAVALYGLLNHNNTATLLGAAGAALAGSQYEKDRHNQSQNNDRYYYRSGDRNGYDRNGYDNSGYNRDGYNHDGYNRDGYNHDGYNRDNYNRDGYNRDGFNRDGYNRNGDSRNSYRSSNGNGWNNGSRNSNQSYTNQRYNNSNGGNGWNRNPQSSGNPFDLGNHHDRD